MTSETARDVEAAAGLYGVETSWIDDAGERRSAPVDVVLDVLARLGAPVDGAADLEDAARLRRRSIWDRTCPPVRVSPAGETIGIPLRLEAGRARGPLEWIVVREGGGAESGRVRVEELGLAGGSTVDGRRFEIRRLDLPGLPAGYHRAVLRHGTSEYRLPLVATPARCYRGDDDGPASSGAGARGGLDGSWGAFHPLFGLRSGRGDGVGDLGTLDEALSWIASRGGRLFGTTPLLAGFDEPPVDPSPYAPASRLFWNELYVRVEDVEGAPATEPAEAELVPWDDVARARTGALEALAERFFREGGERSTDFRRFLVERPDAGDFARFMAARRAWGGDWRAWPEPARSGSVPLDAVDARLVRRHLVGQWLADRQLARVAARGGLYMDVPLGAHSDGYDVWRHRSLFASGVAAGAPPDDFFRGGQNWGLPPLHPERIREDGFAHVAAVLRHAMRPASLVRLDHVMQLHRLFWIPEGARATDGVYVRYPADELAGVVALESHRGRCEVVGEDLGTVPNAVRGLMERWGIRRTLVLGFGLDAAADGPASFEVPDGCVATIETHDMFPLAGLREAGDVAERAALGLLEEDEADRLRRRRDEAFARLDAELGAGRPAAAAVDPLTAPLLAAVGAGPAGIVIAPLDDLFGRRLPQNVPGTTDERPNWRRRLPGPLSALPPEGERALEVLAAARRARRPEPARATA